MSESKDLASLYEKLKSSPHWREDFKIVEVQYTGGFPVYSVEADDQDPKTILAIVKLNEMLEK